jgi:hypothetical protein
LKQQTIYKQLKPCSMREAPAQAAKTGKPPRCHTNSSGVSLPRLSNGGTGCLPGAGAGFILPLHHATMLPRLSGHQAVRRIYPQALLQHMQKLRGQAAHPPMLLECRPPRLERGQRAGQLVDGRGMEGLVRRPRTPPQAAIRTAVDAHSQPRFFEAHA